MMLEGWALVVMVAALVFVSAGVAMVVYAVVTAILEWLDAGPRGDA